MSRLRLSRIAVLCFLSLSRRPTQRIALGVAALVVVAACAHSGTTLKAGGDARARTEGRPFTRQPVVLHAPRDAKLTGSFLLHFEASVPKSAIQAMIRDAGATITQLLPSVNGVVVRSDEPKLTESLMTRLIRLPGLLAFAPVPYFQPHQAQWDNDRLSSADAVAYASIRMPQAAAALASAPPTWGGVRVGIIDSGLNGAFGQRMEFGDGIRYYDLCTSEGFAGEPTPANSAFSHGSLLTGIVAGANNGVGNNGILRLVPLRPRRGMTPSAIVGNWIFWPWPTRAWTSVFGTQCDNAGLDGNLIIRAMDLIVSRFSADVVLMAFGLGSADDGGKQWLSNFFEPFFRSQTGKNILWVASAGNNNLRSDCDGFLQFPAGLACRLPNVVSVGGYDPSTGRKVPLSNFGNAITINAPGAAVYTSTGPGVYGPARETSAAAAMVAGAAGVSAATKKLFASQSKFALQDSRQPLADSELPQGGLDVAALIALPEPAPLAISTQTGSSGGGRKLEPAPFQQPGLAGFELNFSQEDHEVEKVATGYMPPGIPGADPVTMVNLSDDNADDDYSWRVDGQALPRGTTMHKAGGTEHRGIGGIGTTLLPPGSVGTPVLTGFALHFNNGEHHLRSIKVDVFRDSFDQIILQIGFADKNRDDPFTWEVAFALVPDDRVESIVGLTGSGRGSHSQSLPAVFPVMQGFELSFDNTDHHIDEIGVRLQPGQLVIRYNDNDDDDSFSWRVVWVELR